MGDLIISKIYATTEIKDLITFSWGHVILVILIAIVLTTSSSWEKTRSGKSTEKTMK